MLSLRSSPHSQQRLRARCPVTYQARCPDICRAVRKVMPGVSFAAPGPAGDGGSLASRRIRLPRSQLRGWLSRAALGFRTIRVCPIRLHYYDPLRMPNVHREILRYQLVSPYLSPPLFLHTRDRPGGATGLSGRELWYRGRLPRVSPRIDPRFQGQETMRPSQVPVRLCIDMACSSTPVVFAVARLTRHDQCCVPAR